jgi:hypothetical protein
MNTVFSDPARPPARPTPEAWALRADWRQEPPSLAREEAGHALGALAKAAAETAGAVVSDEVPPVPEELRSRWAEAYGRPDPVPVPVRTADDRRDKRSIDRMAAWLFPRGAVWVGGAGAATAAVFLAVSQQDADRPAGFGAGGPLRLRGGGTVVEGEAASIVVIVPAGAGTEVAGVSAVVRQAFPGRDVRVVAGADEAAAAARSGRPVVVVNPGSGLVTAWRGGQLGEEFPPVDGGGGSSGVISRIESADEWLEMPAAAP